MVGTVLNGTPKHTGNAYVTVMIPPGRFKGVAFPASTAWSAVTNISSLSAASSAACVPSAPAPHAGIAAF